MDYITQQAMVFRKKPWYAASLAEVNWIKLDIGDIGID